LLAHENTLAPPDKQKFVTVSGQIAAIQKRLGEAGQRLEVKYYAFTPAYSLFIADDLVIFGANFPDARSRATPSVISDVRGSVAQSYVRLFELHWNP
jgi:hypothetical protein